MNMSRKIAKGNVRASPCALVLFGFLGVFAFSAWGQDCTPVVYAFRHAEDTNPPDPPPLFALTPTGMAHAALYPAMIEDFQAVYKLCPVTIVYAATTKDKPPECGSQCKSATNAFETARPLARAVMGSDARPITTAGGLELYEFLGNGNTAPTDPKYDKPEAAALRKALLETANLNQSSAIFWTSQGLHVLGGAVINRTSNVPVKNGSAVPPRNAVYLFKADGSAPNIGRFHDTPSISKPTSLDSPPSSVYVQCFNRIEPTTQPTGTSGSFVAPTGDAPTQAYYCGYNPEQSNVGGKPWDSCDEGAQCGAICNDPTPDHQCGLDEDPCDPCKVKSNKDIKGKICDTTSTDPTSPTFMLNATSGPSIFGACN
jgi:hypothetical protein